MAEKKDLLQGVHEISRGNPRRYTEERDCASLHFV